MAREPAAGNGELITPAELMWLRHLLQMLSEQSRTVRDSIAPSKGLRITPEVWAGQWDALKRELDQYTAKLLSGRGPVAVTKFLDHNE